MSMRNGRTRCLCAALTLALAVGCLTALPPFGTASPAAAEAPAADDGETLAGTPITRHTGGRAYDDATVVTYRYDFSMRGLSAYTADPSLKFENRAAARVEDGALKALKGQDFAFGSTVCLGDDYGLEEGYLTFDLSLLSGSASLCVRSSVQTAASGARGLWFTFTAGADGVSLVVSEPESGLRAEIPFARDLTEARTLTLHDGTDVLTLSCGDAPAATVRYTPESLEVLGPDGRSAASGAARLDPTGFWTLRFSDADSSVDNVAFTHVSYRRDIPTADSLRVVDYSTWTATDALGRVVADHEAAGDPKDNRKVGLFYFLCWIGAGLTVQDNTKLYLDGGIDGVKRFFEEGRGGEAYWAEPYFGYYINTDTWVYRKHAYMLKAAGVDFVFLDVSNAQVFIPGHTALFNTWLEMRREGIDTPQIVFFNGDSPDTMKSNMTTLLSTVYAPDNYQKYEELFFQWRGKPLVFGNLMGVKNPLRDKVKGMFTVRRSWAWQDRNNCWPWLTEYKTLGGRAKLDIGGFGRDSTGKYESLCVALGHHAPPSKGRSYVNGREPNNGLGDYEFSSIERAGRGLCFEAQFQAAQDLIRRQVPDEDPFVLMITGWNEWIAGCFQNEDATAFCNSQSRYIYVDNFNAEFSRDAEPMRNRDGYGFGDNYYYQMTDYIRRYKGVAPTPVATGQGTADLLDVASFDGVGPAYMDSLYDTELRNTRGYDATVRYINGTGRNDIEYAKVSQDANALYFLVKCRDDVIVDDGDTWMNLYLNTDADPATGWEGYDYLLNRDRDSYVVTVERLLDAERRTEVVGGAPYRLDGPYLTIRLSKDLIGAEGTIERMIFKWADHSVSGADAMGFMDLGDAAPDNRFGFLYLCEGCSTTAPAPAIRPRTGEAAVPPSRTSVPKPERRAVSVRRQPVEAAFDLKGEKSGVSVRDSALGAYFEDFRGTPSCTEQVVEENGRKFVRLKGYTDMRAWKEIQGPYEFSVDAYLPPAGAKNGSGAIHLRGEIPGALRRINQANFGIEQSFDYFEWDWYRENHGKVFDSSTAGSGVGFYLYDDHVAVRIKRHAPDGLNVAATCVEIPYTEATRPDENGRLRFRFTDDGATLRVLCNGGTLCALRMEHPGVSYPDDGTGQAYFGRAVLLGADGAELVTVDDTRLNSFGSQIALSTRTQTMEVSNIRLSYTDEIAEGSRVEEALPASAGAATAPLRTDLLTTLSLGKDQQGAAGPDDATAAPTGSEGTAPSGPAATDPSGTDPGAPSGRKGCRSLIRAPYALLLVAAAVCLETRRRRAGRRP